MTDYNNGLRRKSKYQVNTNAFQKISPATAYVLGFILADGNIHKGESVVSITNTDYDILDKIRRELRSTHLIRQTHAERVGKPQFLLELSDRRLVASLIARGITPAKSLTASMPILPEHLFFHFLRGYFDGDGCCKVRSTGYIEITFVSGSKELVGGIRDATCRLLELPNRKIQAETSGAYRISFGGKVALSVRDAMYRGCGDLFIAYKHARCFNGWVPYHGVSAGLFS